MSWIEVRDSTGRCECGSFEYAVYYARKWMTTAFVAAHPDLIWLHAAAASRDGNAIVLAGPAGAGKSTLLLQLVDRAWHLLADDAVALRQDCGEALPLPFSPEVRAAPASPSRTGPISSRNRRHWRQSHRIRWRRSRRQWPLSCSPSMPLTRQPVCSRR